MVEVAAAGVNFVDIGVRRWEFWTGNAASRARLGSKAPDGVVATGGGRVTLQLGQRWPGPTRPAALPRWSSRTGHLAGARARRSLMIEPLHPS